MKHLHFGSMVKIPVPINRISAMGLLASSQLMVPVVGLVVMQGHDFSVKNDAISPSLM